MSNLSPSTGLRIPAVAAINARGPAPLIAIDLDDVLVTTNETIAQWHNETYGTDLVLSDFHYYHYWKNRGWGTPRETLDKVTTFLASPQFQDAPAVSGAVQGIAELRRLGFRLAIVTARSIKQQDITEKWIAKHLPDSFEAVYYTGEFELKEPPNGATHKMGKPEVIRSIGAVALVDDALDNAMSCAASSPPIPALLFGEYQWNRRHSRLGADANSKERLSFAQRQSQDSSPWWERDVVDDSDLPKLVCRVADWLNVVEACQRMFL